MKDAARLTLAAALTWAVACSRSAPETKPHEHDASASLPPAPSASALIAEAMSDLRARSLDPPPLRASRQAIAFGVGRLATLGESEVIVRDAEDGHELARHAVQRGRAVVPLVDGGLLVPGLDRTLRIPTNDRPPISLPRLPLLAGSLVLPDLRERDRVWTYDGVGASLFPFSLDADAKGELLLPEEPLDLKGARGTVLTTLFDGAVLYVRDRALTHAYPGGISRPIALPDKLGGPGAPARLCPGHRVDTAWLVWADGHVVLAQVTPRLRVFHEAFVPGALFDAASGGEWLALVTFDHVTGAERRWKLTIVDEEGKVRLAAALPAEGRPSAADDWVAELTATRNVTVSRDARLVAVGGRDTVSVWQPPRGDPLWAR